MVLGLAGVAIVAASAGPPSLGHRHFILAIAFLIGFQTCGPLLSQARPDAMGLPVLAAGCALNRLAIWSGLTAIGPLAFSVFVGGWAFLVLGRGLARSLAPPLAFLLASAYLAPVALSLEGWLERRMIYPLQFLTVWGSARLMAFMGVPVSTNRSQIIAAHFVFDIAPACSGIRSIFASLVLAAFYLWRSRVPARRRWILLAVAVVVPLAINIGSIALSGVVHQHHPTWPDTDDIPALSLLPYLPLVFCLHSVKSALEPPDGTASKSPNCRRLRSGCLH